MVGEETVRSIFEAKQYGIDRSQASINDSSSTYISHAYQAVIISCLYKISAHE
ncbi:hypothetical protein AB4K20DRAFT_1925652 [Rhizopus microsporus]